MGSGGVNAVKHVVVNVLKTCKAPSFPLTIVIFATEATVVYKNHEFNIVGLNYWQAQSKQLVTNILKLES